MDTQVAIIFSALALFTTVAWGEDLNKSKTGDQSGETFLVVSSSKLIGEEKTTWIDSMRNKLSMAQRETGPFGLPQDPGAEAAKPKREKIEKGAFLEAIAAIKVNTVMPSDNKFTIGSREFIEGDVFPLIKDQRQFNIEVVSVNMGSILFKNVNTGKLVKRNLHSLPAGMMKNSSLVAIQGIFPANKRNALPLNLDDEPLPVSND